MSAYLDSGVARFTSDVQSWLDSCDAVVAWRACPGDQFLQFDFDPRAEVYDVPSGVWFELDRAPAGARKAFAARCNADLAAQGVY